MCFQMLPIILVASDGVSHDLICPVWAREHCRISPPRFLAECCKRQLNQGSLFCCILGCLLFLICIEFVLAVFSCTVLFVSISQVIGCEDRLRNDLYCVEWGVKLYSNQPTTEFHDLIHRRAQRVAESSCSSWSDRKVMPASRCGLASAAGAAMTSPFAPRNVNSHPGAHTHTHPFNGPFPGLPRWSGTRKVKPIWILLKQETVSGSGISWAICKSAPRYRQITMPAPHHSVFLQAGCPSCHPTNSIKALKAMQHQ